MASGLNVCIIGHSYIRRLEEYCSSKGIINLKLDDSFNVNFRGKGGLRLRHLNVSQGLGARRELFHFISPPDIIFLQVGENDISDLTCCEKLAGDLISVAAYLRDGVGVKMVIIGQLIRRLPFAACKSFNDKVVKTNTQLEIRTQSLPGIHFWRHRGFWHDLSYLGQDGVHLCCTPSHDQPMRKFLRSIRNAVIQSPNLLRPV
ncbi:uncharacterized protein LOC133199635 [Saccostrea echinata]|uniref:uncharacterized protein LOC133199635 n=1 Tax=Saccostrea echinata TaxID=191078 RepID=UPI002A7F23EF|nr:uncharacterized protein LOC133199635 [Saccostrea echinata]